MSCDSGQLQQRIEALQVMELYIPLFLSLSSSLSLLDARLDSTSAFYCTHNYQTPLII